MFRFFINNLQGATGTSKTNSIVVLLVMVESVNIILKISVLKH